MHRKGWLASLVYGFALISACGTMPVHADGFDILGAGPESPASSARVSGGVDIPDGLRKSGVFFGFSNSSRISASVRDEMAKTGYVLCNDRNSAMVTIYAKGEITIKGKGRANLGSFIELGDNADFVVIEANGKSNAGSDAGVIQQSRNLTGSWGAGFLLSMAIQEVSNATGMSGAFNGAFNKALEYTHIELNVTMTDVKSGKTQRATIKAADNDTARMTENVLARMRDIILATQ